MPIIKKQVFKASAFILAKGMFKSFIIQKIKSKNLKFLLSRLMVIKLSVALFVLIFNSFCSPIICYAGISHLSDFLKYIVIFFVTYIYQLQSI